MRAIIQGFNKTLNNYSLPDNIISIGSVPHSWLFQHAHCVIHHGGLSTTATALKAGIPSIVIPHVLDQHFWAKKLFELGVSTEPIKVDELNQELLIKKINYLKSNYKVIYDKVKIISRKINKEDGLHKTVELIQEINKVLLHFRWRETSDNFAITSLMKKSKPQLLFQLRSNKIKLTIVQTRFC